MKTDLMKIFNDLDEDKFDIMEEDMAFDLVAIDTHGAPQHTGIGTGEQMSLMALISLADLYKFGARDISEEDFAESVKQNLLKFLADYDEIIKPVGRN